MTETRELEGSTPHATSATVRRVGLGLATVAAWVALLRVNGPVWDHVVYRWAGLDEHSRIGSAVHFFLFDTVKITLLLAGIIFAVTVLRSFVTLERTRALLGGRREGVGNVMAAGLGVVTPFCSCSAVPAFLGFVAAGVPLGVTLSFLIASPLVNEVAVVLDALAELSVDADIDHVTDYAAIAAYGVMSTPALVVDEQVVLAGRVPTAAQVRELLAPLIPAS